MSVVYDLLGFQSREHGERGIARYVQQLALAIEAADPDFVDHYLVHPHLPIPTGIDALLTSGKVVRADKIGDRIDLREGGVFLAGSLFEQLNAPLELVLPLWARRPEWRTAAVLYDLIPLLFPDWYLSTPVVDYEYRARVAMLQNFDVLLAISDATAGDAQTLLGIPGDRLATIWAGADDQFRPPSIDRHDVGIELLDRIEGIRPDYLFFPTGIDYRKNVERLIEAYAGLSAELRSKHQLVLVCRTTPDQEWALKHLAVELGVGDDLLVTGFVSDDDLVMLYQGAELVVFPAIYEGFGLPILEAMRCGAPVICSDTSSMVEVQTDPTARFDPSSVEAITHALQTTLDSPERREQLRSQSIPDFSWNRAAEITIDRLQPMASATHAFRGRPSLGLVTPLPPQQSGIAIYALRLLEHLTEQFDVTVFVDGDVDEIHPIDRVSIQPLAQLPRLVAAGAGPDEVVYFIGNSWFHVEALEILAQVPGDVILHDVRLSGLYSEVQRLRPERLPGGSMGLELEAMYPERYRRAVIAEAHIDPATTQRFGIFMCAEVVNLARRVFVHSEHAADLVELDTGVRPAVAFPMPCLEPDEPWLGDQPGPPVISSFGIVWRTKNPELIIGAVAELLPDFPDLQLVLAGSADPDYQIELEELAESLGATAALSIPGHLDDDEFAALRQRSTAAVQLRSVTNGESSLAVAETLTAGVPTIVSRLGAMADLPKDVVIHLDPSADASVLARELRTLLEQPEIRRQRSEAGRRFAESHSYAAAAERLSDLLTVRSADRRAPTRAD